MQHPRLTVVEDDVVLPSGLATTYIRFNDYADYPTLVVKNAEGMILLNREYAYPPDKVLFQFPEGSQEKGETLLEAAQRELGEEAGLRAGKLTVLGTNYHYHRRTEAMSHIVLAEELAEYTALGDPEEVGIISSWHTEDEIWQMIKSGKIVQKNTLAAWATYQAHLKP